MATLKVLLGATSNIATAEQSDPYFAVAEGSASIAILPPVYSLSNFSVTVNFQAVNDPAVPGENYQVISVAATTSSTFDYSTTTSSATITEKASPFGSTWYCLMQDYSYKTFNTDDEVIAATNPAYKALVSFNLTPPYQILKTHQFQVTMRDNATSVTEVVTVSLTEAIYLNVPSFIAKVQSLVATGA
jgi:hypothetical protein